MKIKKDWQLNDEVLPDDLNQIGRNFEEVNSQLAKIDEVTDLKLTTKAEKDKVIELEQRVSDLIVSNDLNPNKDSELVDARQGFGTLNENLQNISEKMNIEGSVVENICKNSNFQNGTTDWKTEANQTIEINNSNNLVATITSGQNSFVSQITGLQCEENKRVLVRVECEFAEQCAYASVNYFGTLGGGTEGAGTLFVANPEANKKYILYGVISLNSTYRGDLKIAIKHNYANSQIALNKSLIIKNVVIADISKFIISVNDLNVDFANLKYFEKYSNLYNSYINKNIENVNDKVNKFDENHIFNLKNICKNSDFTNGTTDWTSESGQTIEINSAKNLVATITADKASAYVSQVTDIDCAAGKKIYLRATISVNSHACLYAGINHYGTNGGGVAASDGLIVKGLETNKRYVLEDIVTLDSSFKGKFRFIINHNYANPQIAKGLKLIIDDFVVVELEDVVKHSNMIVDLPYFKRDYNIYTKDKVVKSINDTGFSLDELSKKVDKRTDLEMIKTNTLNALPFILPDQDYPPQPILTITYDDECESIYKYAFPVHKSEKVPGTFFVVPSRIGDGKEYQWGYSDTWDHIQEMDSYTGEGRIKIECHSHGHENLPRLSEKQLNDNFRNSIELFNEKGINIRHISYPGGYYTKLVQFVAQKYFTTCRTTKGGYMDYTVHPHTIVSRGMDGHFEYAKTEIDECLKRGNCWISFFLHGIDPSGQVTSPDTGTVRPVLTPDELRGIIQYAKSKGVKVVSYDEAVATYCPSQCWINRNGDAPFVVQRDGLVTKFTGDPDFTLD